MISISTEKSWKIYHRFHHFYSKSIYQYPLPQNSFHHTRYSLDGAIDSIQEFALSEAQKHGKSFAIYGAKVEVKEMGTKWYFDKTGDPVIARIADQKDQISKAEKDRQSFLKTLKEKMAFLDEESGEVFTVYPARKESKTGIAISII